jgi:hypothetical protein
MAAHPRGRCAKTRRRLRAARRRRESQVGADQNHLRRRLAKTQAWLAQKKRGDFFRLPSARMAYALLSTHSTEFAQNHHEVGRCCHNDCRSHRGRWKVVTWAFPILRIIVAGRVGDRACRLERRRTARSAIQRTNGATGRRDSRFVAGAATHEPFAGTLFLIRRPPGATRSIRRQADASLCHGCLLLAATIFVG